MLSAEMVVERFLDCIQDFRLRNIQAVFGDARVVDLKFFLCGRNFLDVVSILCGAEAVDILED